MKVHTHKKADTFITETANYKTKPFTLNWWVDKATESSFKLRELKALQADQSKIDRMWQLHWYAHYRIQVYIK